jgi:hypothetical protein
VIQPLLLQLHCHYYKNGQIHHRNPTVKRQAGTVGGKLAIILTFCPHTSKLILRLINRLKVNSGLMIARAGKSLDSSGRRENKRALMLIAQ